MSFPQTAAYLRALRAQEFAAMLGYAKPYLQGKKVLEIGSGDGTQLKLLQQMAANVVGVDILVGTMVKTPQAGVVYYNGQTLPFPDASFEALYTSHTLEHVQAWPELNAEMHRVLISGGMAVHVVPNAVWRVLSWLTHFPAQPKRFWQAWRRRSQPVLQPVSENTLMPQRPLAAKLQDILWPTRHSEFGNRATEVAHLTPNAWRTRLQAAGWQVLQVQPLPYAYTDNMLLASHLPWGARAWLGQKFGLASATLLVVKKA